MPSPRAPRDRDRDYERTFLARHAALVDQTDDLLGCWLWRGTVNSNGYGRMRGGLLHFSLSGIRGNYGAHRVALAAPTCPADVTIFQFMDQLTHWDGGVSDREAAHEPQCVSRLCCNPVHLRWKTHRQNCLDIIARYGGLGLPAHDRGTQLAT